MADILTSAQTTDSTTSTSSPTTPAGVNPLSSEPSTGTSSSVPPEPPPEPFEETKVSAKSESVQTSSTDSLIVPPKDTTSSEPPKTPDTDKTSKSQTHTPKPLRKEGSKIGIILATVLLLLITLPLGVYYVSQQQQQLADVRSRAADVYPTPSVVSGCTGIKNYSTSMTPVSCNTNGTQGTFAGTCIFYHCPNGCDSTGGCGENTPGVHWEYGSCNSGKLASDECGQIDTVNTNGTYCIPSTGCDALKQCGPSCRGVTATPKPTTAPQCPAIKVYQGTNLITNYATLMPGDSISIYVGLTATKIRINGATNFTTLTTKSSDGKYWQYDVTIPTDRTNFSIEVQ